MIYLNIGCGRVFHPEWMNYDIQPICAAVKRLDARRSWPFADSEVDVIYHSHVLEHLKTNEANTFLTECRRVLKPGGVMRVVVPDLEGIALTYLRELETARKSKTTVLYDWMILEIIDQLTREKTGGQMLHYLRTITSNDLALLRVRAGDAVVQSCIQTARPALWRRLTFSKVWQRGRIEVGALMLLCLGGRAWTQAFREGLFRKSGEVHRQMYDEFSLGRLLLGYGFLAPVRRTAYESAISRFAEFELDMVQDTVRKPDSLFMEVVKPRP
jgi:SAM-dependent methyltransferase